MGVRISIDNFGMGYSNLSNLAQIPFDVLKIDQSFALKITTNPKDVTIISGIINIAKKLEMEVIAEGVETAEQLEIYKAAGCHLIQGFYFSPAVPDESIPDLIKAGIKMSP